MTRQTPQVQLSGRKLIPSARPCRLMPQANPAVAHHQDLNHGPPATIPDSGAGRNYPDDPLRWIAFPRRLSCRAVCHVNERLVRPSSTSRRQHSGGLRESDSLGASLAPGSHRTLRSGRIGLSARLNCKFAPIRQKPSIQKNTYLESGSAIVRTHKSTTLRSPNRKCMKTFNL